MAELLTLIRMNPESWSTILKSDPYCLKINRDGDLVCFTYSPRSHPANSINKTCRGIIIDVEKMQIICYPLDRFFNHEEKHASTLDFNDSVVALEKIDGSIIKLYYYDNNWLIATRGYCKADTQFITQWNTVACEANGFNYDKLNKRYTYVFEIVGPSNKVVVEYSKNDLYHITTRNLDTLLEIEVDIGIKKPQSYDIFNNNDSKINNAIAVVSTFDPRKSEGMVLVDRWYNRVKIKSHQYIILHNQLAMNNKANSDQTCIQLIITGEADEYLVARPDMANTINRVNNRLNCLIARLEAIHHDILLKAGHNPSRKTFSDTVFTIDSLIPSLHFSLYKGQYKNVKEYIYAYNEPSHCKLIAGHLSPDESKRSMDFVSWVRFGSPDSTDDDIAVVLNNRNVQFDDSKLRKELSNKEGQKELDINLITIGSDGHINWCHKGDLHETQNIIWHTYGYHQQNYSCPVSTGIPVNAIDPEKKIRAVSKYFLDNCQELCGPEFYFKNKKQKDLAYSGTPAERVAFVTLMSSSLLPFDNFSMKSHIKTIVLKICQVILFEYGVLEYNKLLIPEKIKTYWNTCDIDILTENIAYFLSRGKLAQNTESKINSNDNISRAIRLLIEEYCQITLNYVETLIWINIPINIDFGTSCFSDKFSSTKFYELFLASPVEPTDEMLNLFIQLVGDERSINKIFESESKNAHLLPRKFVESHVHLEAQRSNEWKKLLSFYRCGRNSGIRTCELNHIKEYFRFHWNLIRGNIAENIVLNSLRQLNNDNSLDVLKGELIQVGLLVEEKKFGSIGIAPDLLLKQETGSVVPVEIKTVLGKINKNHAGFRREISLAKRQLNSSKQILKDINPLNEAYIIVVYLENDKCSIEIAKV